MGRKILRLTESDLHNLISEAVTMALNEIGDTSRGQFMLARLYQKQEDEGDKKKSDETYEYAQKKARNGLNGLNKRQRFQRARTIGSDLQRMIDLTNQGIQSKAWGDMAQKNMNGIYNKLRDNDKTPNIDD